jgi:protein TonB
MKKTLITFSMVAAFAVAKAQTSDTLKGLRADTLIFVAVQQPPTFPGGMGKWLEYVKRNLNYPEKDKAEGFAGKVFVTFVIEKDGSVSNPRVVRGIGGACDVEARRLVKDSPKWNPGMQNEKAVRVQYTTMIEFKP